MTAAVVVLAMVTVALTLALIHARIATGRARAEAFDLTVELARAWTQHRLPYETTSGTPVHDALTRERRGFGVAS